MGDLESQTPTPNASSRFLRPLPLAVSLTTITTTTLFPLILILPLSTLLLPPHPPWKAPHPCPKTRKSRRQRARNFHFPLVERLPTLTIIPVKCPTRLTQPSRCTIPMDAPLDLGLPLVPFTPIYPLIPISQTSQLTRQAGVPTLICLRLVIPNATSSFPPAAVLVEQHTGPLGNIYPTCLTSEYPILPHSPRLRRHLRRQLSFLLQSSSSIPFRSSSPHPYPEWRPWTHWSMA